MRQEVLLMASFINLMLTAAAFYMGSHGFPVWIAQVQAGYTLAHFVVWFVIYHEQLDEEVPQ